MPSLSSLTYIPLLYSSVSLHPPPPPPPPVARLSVEAVQTFLEEYKFSKYSETFRSHLIDGDRLMVADDNMLKDLGVSSAIDRKKIITKFRQFVKN